MTNEHAALCFAAAAAARWLAGWLARWLAGWPAHHGATQGTTADILQGCSGVGVLLQLNSPQSKPPDETILWCTAACHARTNLLSTFEEMKFETRRSSFGSTHLSGLPRFCHRPYIGRAQPHILDCTIQSSPASMSTSIE